jgi:endo-1,4-beta-D-glucanase Y
MSRDGAFSGLFAALAVLWSAGCAKAPDTGGGAGSGGGAAGAPGVVMKDPSNYPQNTAGAAFPYPQGHASAYCSFPIYSTDSVATAYTNWKAKFFDGTKVIRPENGNDTVSEGIGYGMLIGVFMNDKAMFDLLWAYAKSHFDGNGLMNWCIASGMKNSCGGTGGATDGDEDMAYALLMASKQWSGGTYASDANTLIGNIMSHEVESGSNVLKPGDNFGGASEMDPSYLAPSYYRAFAAATGNSKWMDVLNESYTILAAASGQYGLVPNWATSSGAGIAGTATDGHGPDFGYDACRTPFRIAIDYCINGEARAQSYAGLIAGFYASKTTANSLAPLVDGYTPAGAALDSNPAGMSFIGPGGVAAMAAGNDAFRDLVYTSLWADTTQGAMQISGVFSYFNASWGVLSLLEMSGNFWDMTQTQ